MRIWKFFFRLSPAPLAWNPGSIPNYCIWERPYNIQAPLSKWSRAGQRVTPPSWWMFGANLWHWSHFFTYSCASFCMFSHQYPWVRALWDNDLSPMWLSQIPSCNSSRSSLTASGCMYSRYGLEKDLLYNFWSSNSQNRGAFLRTLSAFAFALSLGRTSSLRNNTMESI